MTADTPDPRPVSPPSELTAEEESFWATHCGDCGHDMHPMNVCSIIVGGDQNGPDYCPCALDYPALAAEYQRSLAARAAPQADATANSGKISRGLAVAPQADAAVRLGWLLLGLGSWSVIVGCIAAALVMGLRLAGVR